MNKISLLSFFCCLAFLSNAKEVPELEKIEVRAQKRTQNIHDVAIAVTSLDRQTLVDLNIQDSYQLSHLSPNLLITENAGAGSPPAVTIRGVGLMDYNTSNTSPIAFYFDDAVIGSVNNQFADLFDIQAVEVLRGPQGTLFGRNTSGGALQFFSNTPEDHFTAYITGGLGSDQYKKAEVMLNIPINESSATRLSAQHLGYDFSATNNLANAPQEGSQRNSLRWQYALNTDAVEINLKLNTTNWQGISQPYGHTGIIEPQTASLCSPQKALQGDCVDAFGFNDGSDNFRDVSVDNNSPHNSEQWGSRLKLLWHISPSLDLTSISAFNDLERTHTIHCDASSIDVCVGSFGLNNDVFSQEVRLNGRQQNVDWITGLFFLKENLKQNNSIDLLRDFRFLGQGAPSAQYFYHNTIATESSAVFAQLDYYLTDRLTLTGGARYSNESSDFTGDTDLNVPLDNDPVGITFPFWRVADDISNSRWSGKLAASYDIDPNWMWYASINSGFKSGGFNGGFLFAEEEAKLAAYGPETLYAYEIGTKADLWANTARLALNIFYYDYRDQQVFINQPSQTPNSPNLQLLKNVAQSTIWGAEGEFEWQISPQLKVKLGAGYIPNAEFDKYIDPTGNELGGNKLPFTPKLQLSFNGEYQYPISKGNYIMLSLLGRYQSEMFFDQNESLYTHQEGYSLWDAVLAYHNEQNNWKLMLNAKNLFDQQYDTLRFDLVDFLGLVNSNKGEGRRILLEFNYSFAN